MKNFTVMKGFLSLFLLLVFAATELSAQTASISPLNPTILVNGSQNFTVTTTGFGANDNNRTFVYTITGPGATVPASPAVFNCTSGCNSETHSIQFLTAGTYTVSVVVTQTQNGSAEASASTTVNVSGNVLDFTPNLYSTSGTGTVKAWNVDPVSGAVLNGPADLFTPSASTAALGKNQPNTHASDLNGYLYWLPNSGTNGIVTVNAHNPNGSGTSTNIASFDFNGPGDNTSLGFVRLAIDPFGWGWILAGGGGSLYLGKFLAQGTTNTQGTIQVVNSSVIVAGGGSVADFQNGDLAFAGNGVMYALANVTDGVTGIYTMDVTSQTTTLTRRWTLVQPGGGNFSGSVNGVAFTQSGSLHISTANGLFFIDQNTASQQSGTVECALVTSLTGLTDLASDKFPAQTTLPVRLLTFSGTYRNQVAALNWETENEQNFSHFEVERSSNGTVFTAIGNKPSLRSTGRSAYQHNDNLAAVSGNAFWYRLKIVDLDGQFKYSNVIMVRKDDKVITGIMLSPNPVRGDGIATIRFNSSQSGLVTIRVLDMTGRVVLQQQSKTYEGTNSLPLNNADRLQPGSYVIQVAKEDEVSTAKFTVVR